MLGCLLVSCWPRPGVAQSYKGTQVFFPQNTPGSCGPACAKMTIATLTGQLVGERALHRAAGGRVDPPLPKEVRHDLAFHGIGMRPWHPWRHALKVKRALKKGLPAPRSGSNAPEGRPVSLPREVLARRAYVIRRQQAQKKMASLIRDRLDRLAAPTRGEYGWGGVTETGLLDAIRRFNLDATAVHNIGIDQLAGWSGSPLIARVSDGKGWRHAVVVDGVGAGKVKIRDPAVGKVSVPVSRFQQYFSGDVIRATARPGVQYPQPASSDDPGVQRAERALRQLLTGLDYRDSPSWPEVSGFWNRMQSRGRLLEGILAAP